MEIVEKKTKWLWRVGRLTGLLPVVFVKCSCAPRPPTAAVERGASRRVAAAEEARRGGARSPRPRGRGGGRCVCRGGRAVRPCRRWSAYSLGLVALLVPCTAAVLYVDVMRGLAGLSPRMHTKTDRMVTISDLLLVLLSCVVGILQAWGMRRGVPRFVEELHTVDSLLGARPPGVPALLLVWLVLLVGLCAVDVLGAYLTVGPIYAALFLPSQVNYLVCFVMEALFADDAHCIFLRFRTLNERLEAACHDLARRHPSRLELERAGRGLPDPLLRVLSMVKEGWAAGANAAAEVGVLHRLQDAHALLCAGSTNVTRRFGLGLLIDTVNLLLHFVITSYFFFANVEDVRESRYGGLNVALQLLWLGLHFSRIMLLVSPCSRAKEEANRTGALVGTFLNSVHPDSPTHKQLEAFSMQLMHHRVTFSACGLFELDLPLVVSVMGAVTTYVVVLLQMQGPGASP